MRYLLILLLLISTQQTILADGEIKLERSHVSLSFKNQLGSGEIILRLNFLLRDQVESMDSIVLIRNGKLLTEKTLPREQLFLPSLDSLDIFYSSASEKEYFLHLKIKGELINAHLQRTMDLHMVLRNDEILGFRFLEHREFKEKFIYLPEEDN